MEVVDARRGTRRVIDPRASRMTLAGSMLITWDGRYVSRSSSATGLRVFDLGEQAVVSRSTHGWDEVDFLAR